MPADGEMSIRGAIREHNRLVMPHGFMKYTFGEKGDIYGTSFINASLVSGGIAFARFMFYGSPMVIFHRSVPLAFLMTAGVSSFIILQKKTDEKEIKGPKEAKEYLRLRRRVPMDPGNPDMPPIHPAVFEQQYGVTEKPSDKTDCQCDEKKKS